MKLEITFISLLAVGTLTVQAAEAKKSTRPAQSTQHSIKSPKSSGTDPLAWLGPMPDKPSPEMIEKRSGDLFLNLRRTTGKDVNPKDFVCKAPSEVGPIPNMDAVDRYLLSWPDSRGNPELLEGLHEAALQGNWLARSQIFSLVIDSRAANLKTRYRQLQLAEWMYQQRLGPVFTWYIDALAASGYFGPQADLSGMDTFAAFHNSYPAQERAGKSLMRSEDPALVAIGQAMRDCAANASPGYRAIFKGRNWH